MNQLLKIRRGSQDVLPPLNPFELGYTTDTKRLYIGNGVGNILLSNSLSERKSVVRTSVNIALNETHYGVFTEAAVVNISVFLPVALENQGQIYIIKQVLGSKRTNIIPNGADVVENQTALQIKTLESVTIMAENTGWWIV